MTINKNSPKSIGLSTEMGFILHIANMRYNQTREPIRKLDVRHKMVNHLFSEGFIVKNDPRTIICRSMIGFRKYKYSISEYKKG